MNDFSINLFSKSYSITWTNFIVWLPLFLEVLGKCVKKGKASFIIFKGLSVAKNCLRTESAPLKLLVHMCWAQKQPFAYVLQNRFSKKFRNIHRKTPVLESLFKKVVDLKSNAETPTQVLPFKYCEIFKNTLFTEDLRTTAQKHF